MKFLQTLNEYIQSTTADVILCVDIQAEYLSGSVFNLKDWIQYIIQCFKNKKEIVLIFNTSDTSGYNKLYKEWLLSNGLPEKVANYCIFLPKQFGFFRSYMDSGVSEDEIITLVKYMLEHGINDSRDLTSDMWEEIDLPEILEIIDPNELLYIPDLIKDLANLSGEIEIMGGGLYECLAECEILLNILDKTYERNMKYIYD